MTEEQKAAYVFAQAVSALADICGMMAENFQRQAIGSSMAYVEDSFVGVAEKYGITHNQVLSLFHD